MSERKYRLRRRLHSYWCWHGSLRRGLLRLQGKGEPRWTTFPRVDFNEVIAPAYSDVTRFMISAELKFQEVSAIGLFAGLTDDQTREVVTAWLDHYQQTTDEIDWDTIRRAVMRRATGEEWRP
jgi:hypothetical protein